MTTHNINQITHIHIGNNTIFQETPTKTEFFKTSEAVNPKKTPTKETLKEGQKIRETKSLFLLVPDVKASDMVASLEKTQNPEEREQNHKWGDEKINMWLRHKGDYGKFQGKGR